jgi:hypothetical protein
VSGIAATTRAGGLRSAPGKAPPSQHPAWATPDGPQLVDTLGTELALSQGLTPDTGAARVPAVAAVRAEAFSHAQYLLLTHDKHPADSLVPGPAGVRPQSLPAGLYLPQGPDPVRAQGITAP